MKKILLFICIFLLQQNLSLYSQVTRSELAERVFNVLYTSTYDDPDLYDASQFPNPYLDLQDDSEISKKIKILSYLQFDNGRTCFHPEWSYFHPNNYIMRCEALGVMMEAWNISTDDTGSSPYSDVNPEDIYFEYIKSAYDLEIIGGTTFRPWDYITYSEMVDFIDGIINNSSHTFHPVPHSVLVDINTYFVPNNYTPYNMGRTKGLEQGVFSHYAKNSFVIPDVKFNLSFSHFYSSSMVEIPTGFFPIKPLGRGWSHPYNSYILKDNVNGELIYTIIWPDGTIHLWNENNQEYITKGVYDEFNESYSILYITKKDQTRYKYENLDSDRNIYYLVEIRDKNYNKITINYEPAVEDDTKRIEYVEAPSGKRLNFLYREDTDLIEYITDPIGRSIEFVYLGLGSHWLYEYPVLAAFTDAKEQTTSYVYGTDNSYNLHLLRRIVLPRRNEITAQYNSSGKLFEYTINNNEPVEIDVDFDYSGTGEIQSDITVPMPNGETQNFHYEYNENGLLTAFQNDIQNISISYPSSGVNVTLPDNTNMNGVDIDYDYDNRGNLIQIQKEGITDEDFEYDSDNNLIYHEDENGNDTYFYYDSRGNLTSIKDALGKYSYFTYDEHGQLLSETNQEGITVNYTYENDGAVSTITAPENISSSFTYDGINRLLTQTINGQTSSFTYDANDNLLTNTNIGGLTTSFDYDSNDNLVTITNAKGIETNFEYNDNDQLVNETFDELVKQYEYNDDGTLDKYIKPSGDIINYGYHSDGTLNTTGTITDINYNNDGLIESIATADSRLNFYYNSLNRVREIEEANSNTSVEYLYDDVGNLTTLIYPTNPLGLEVHYTYDTKNRLTFVKTKVNGSIKNIKSYQYLDDDRILSSHTYSDNGGFDTYYYYDNAGRKIGISHKKSGVEQFSEMLTLDNRGNVINKNTKYAVNFDVDLGVDLTEQVFTYDNNNHIQGEYQVNDDGNLISDGTCDYTYDIDDQLAERTDNNYTYVYKYDAFGNRILMSVSGGHKNKSYFSRMIWDVLGNNPIMKTDESGDNVYYYNIFGLGLEAQISSDGSSISYYHEDTRGNIILLTDDNSDILQRYKYDDFGKVSTFSTEPVGPGPPEVDKFTFLGKYGILEQDRGAGLYYVKARYYDAVTGRFLTEDPIWSNNLYTYGGNNPLTNIDVSGKNYEPAISKIISNSCINNNGQGLCSASDLNIINHNRDRIRTNQRNIFRFLEVGGETSVIIGFTLTLTGYGAPVGIPMMIYGGIPASFGEIGVETINYLESGNADGLMQTIVIEVGGLWFGNFLKYVDINDIDRELFNAGYQIIMSTIKK